MARFRRPYPGWPTRPPVRFPRFPRGPGARARAFYSPVGQDAALGVTLNANTLYASIIVLDSATPAATVAQVATEDYSVRRLFGVYALQNISGGTLPQKACWHSAIAVLDQDPGGGALDTTQYANFWEGIFTRRLYWRSNWWAGILGYPPAGAPAGQYPQSTYLCPPYNGRSGDQVDIKLAARVRPDQRLCLLEYIEASGAGDSTWLRYLDVRAIVSMTGNRR